MVFSGRGFSRIVITTPHFTQRMVEVADYIVVAALAASAYWVSQQPVTFFFLHFSIVMLNTM